MSDAVLFVIPGALRALAGNRAEVRLERAAGPLGDALSRLWAECPALKDRVMTETGEVRPHINIFVDGKCFCCPPSAAGSRQREPPLRPPFRMGS